MKKYISIEQITISTLFLFALTSAGVFSQSEQSTDSSAVYSLPAVTITANSSASTLFRLPFSSSTIVLSDSTAIHTLSLGEVLASSNGIFIKDYGTQSGIKTISQRGLGSEHTLFLVNGMRVSSFQNGLVDLGVMPLDGADRVVVVRGGQSAEYGSEAVGGTVNIIPSMNFGEGDNIRLMNSLGSFGAMRNHLSARFFSNRSFMLDAGIGQERSNGDFPFPFHNGNITSNVVRQDADLQAQFGHIHSSWLVSPTGAISLFSTYYNSDRGSPGAFTSPSSLSRARQSDKDGICQIGFTESLSGGLAINIAAQGHYAYERYRDPELVVANIPLDDYFRNIDLRLSSKFTDTFENGRYQVTGGIEAARTSAEGNSIQREVSRKETGIFVTGVSNFDFDGSIISLCSLFPAVRMDHIEPSTTVASPQMGGLLKFRLTDFGVFKKIQSAVRASIGRNFRMPTYNELYYATGGGIGNPNLEPEHSTSFDAGSDISFLLAGEHIVKMTYYLIDMENRITWVSAGGLNVTPKNLRHVESKGWEAEYQWRSEGDVVSIWLNYTSTIALKLSEDKTGDPTTGKQLIYVPSDMGNLSFGINQHFDRFALRSLGAKFGLQYSGFRYTTEDNSSFLPSYVVNSAELHGRMDFGINALFKFEIQNIFNQDYQVMLSYPMPMRSYHATLELEY